MQGNYYAVEGRRGNKHFQGIVMTRPGSDIIERGPQETKRISRPGQFLGPMRLSDLEKIARVKPCPCPMLTASIREMLNRKFVLSYNPMEVVERGKLLYLFQEIIIRYNKEKKK